MAVCEKLKEFLEGQGVPYRVIVHPPAFTMQEVAAASGISGYQVAKSVVVRTNGRLSLAVLPAPSMVDLVALGRLMGEAAVALAREEDFAETFKECELGAFCPFGNLYGLEVYLDEELSRRQKMAFNAGTHQDMVELAVEDYLRLAQPKVGSFGLGPR